MEFTIKIGYSHYKILGKGGRFMKRNGMAIPVYGMIYFLQTVCLAGRI